ncbi:MAG: 4a-hydroxytetrahydrobiopterin dehydratase [Candidatus Sumerlaeaceae bacterium]|nr:4a-hydroxytetrahydrobiopterin dehydratase [Candidatus Sumerlaeaceae bacterium]
MIERLTDEKISACLEKVSCWRRQGETIIRDVTCRSFRDALSLVNEIGQQAEQADHHPDILLHSWNKVRVILSTHSAGGLTAKDFELACSIEPVIAEYERSK